VQWARFEPPGPRPSGLCLHVYTDVIAQNVSNSRNAAQTSRWFSPSPLDHGRLMPESPQVSSLRDAGCVPAVSSLEDSIR
jgi:hypothetical protein